MGGGAIKAQLAPPSAASPGAQSDGTTLLPNGWRISPVGRHVRVGDLPLNVVQSPDSKYLIVSNNGLAKPSLSVIDVAAWTVKSTLALDNAWFGLVWSPDGTRLYSAGAAANNIQEFAYADGVLTKARTFALPPASGETFAGGMTISRDGHTLYATRLFAQTLSAIDLGSGQITNTVSLPSEPYACLVSADGKQLYVSMWGGSSIQVYNLPGLSVATQVESGDHPNAMALSADGKRLFVAAGGSSEVWVYDTFAWRALEQISTSLFSAQPPTSTPNSLALSPDGTTLLVATADDNAVAVIDVSNIAASFVNGFIPTGWYPTDAIFSRDGKQIFILSGKGLAPSPTTAGTLDVRLQGAVSAVAAPDRTTLADYTRKVYADTPYTDLTLFNPPNAPIGSPIPQVVGQASPIKHVFYVIRENRTYDQVLGDERSGNGDPKLVLFGRDVTPNAHAIAENFALFDNFYVDADVSYNGHAYSTAAYSNDFVEKLWQTNYGNRGGLYLGEGGGFMRSPYGNIAAPPYGYLWDGALAAELSVRNYGEFALNKTKTASGDVTAVATVPGLDQVTSTSYAAFDLAIRDVSRVAKWQAEFKSYVSNNNLPRLSIIRLGNDHTAGTLPGALSPRAMLADNDVAIGRIVETISNSIYWKDSAIFIVEDDAQSGPDHVDSHRSVLLVASPFAKRQTVDHTFYTTSGVLRTIELILGLAPMSQYDGAATPLYNAFQSTPSMPAFATAVPNVPQDEINPQSAFGASQSLAMDFSNADRAPEALLNEIIWRSIKGAGVPMPPPRRSLFVRPSSSLADDDDR